MDLQPNSICSCVSQGIKCSQFTYVYNSLDNGYYDETCSSVVLASYAMEGISIINDTLPLNFNALSLFRKNATTEMMMNELLLEYWMITTSYDQFFNKCAPVSVIVTIIDIYKSLSEGFRLLHTSDHCSIRSNFPAMYSNGGMFRFPEKKMSRYSRVFEHSEYSTRSYTNI